MKKRVESGDFRVCAAHDLAPILARVLGVDLKTLEMDKLVLELVRTKGLDLGGERWDGLAGKSYAPKGKRKGKKKR